MSTITATLPVASFHVFGSGNAWCSLEMKSGKRVRGTNKTESDNGFVGYVTEDVTLYSKTKVKYAKGAYPGSGFKFEGTWGELVEVLKQRSKK